MNYSNQYEAKFEIEHKRRKKRVQLLCLLLVVVIVTCLIGLYIEWNAPVEKPVIKLDDRQTRKWECRNSIQGRDYIVDDKG